MNHEKEAYILGALLHDIGKFVQRAQRNPKSRDHCKWGEEWFQDNLAEKLTSVFTDDEKDIIRKSINVHHDYFPFIQSADGISASMDRILIKNEEEGDPFTDRLISIFSRISISRKGKGELHYHNLAELEKENLEMTFPIKEKKCNFNEYSVLLEKFNSEIKNLDFKELTPKQIIEQIYFILWKYTWCIPSAAYKHEPDIPLFDHLKISAAITACLFDYDQRSKKSAPEKNREDEEAFVYIAGDISGIQSFILGILTQQGRIAKRLRARSLLIQLLSEIASHQILHKFDLPLCNIISSAGGNFYILAPNIPEAENLLNELQESFDRWMYEEYRGEIFISLAWSKANSNDLSFNIDNLYEKTHKRLQFKKYSPFRTNLISDNSWSTRKFLFKEVIEGDEKACVGCRKHPITNQEEKLCKYCDLDNKVGQKLTRGKYITYFSDDARAFPLLNYSFDILPSLKEEKNAYMIQALNDTKNPQIGFKFIATHIPTAEEVGCKKEEHEHKPGTPAPAFFDCIADASEGDKSLAYVKADVDNMGKIIRYGFHPSLPEDKYVIKEVKPSVSRLCSLSRMLETFFGGVIQLELEKEFPEIYTVFSGGDEFFLLGPWNKIIDFTEKIRKKFDQFTGFNPDLTFSAGITMAKPHEPISFCAESVSEALNCSKARKDETDIELKNAITVFNQTLSWDELKDIVLPEVRKIKEWVDKELVSRQFAYLLWQCALKYEIYKKTCRTDSLEFVPMLAGSINRNLDPVKQEKIFNWTKSLLPSQKKVFSEKLQFLRTIMEYVLAYTRR
ncbi:MAG: type III-A CRISPR-associated protein Cas10/Csm1 [Candidatus Hydrothermarchaeota archaeon]